VVPPCGGGRLFPARPNDATGFKTGERLLDIPQADIPATRDFSFPTTFKF